MNIGKHVILDITTDSVFLTNSASMCEIFKSVAINVGCTVLFERAHSFSDTNGYTAIIGLAESHISIHTWPEYNFAAVDVFMCGENDAIKAADQIISHFDSKTYKMRVIERNTD
jgi:S-adenosylmethionine decarboxylase